MGNYLPNGGEELCWPIFAEKPGKSHSSKVPYCFIPSQLTDKCVKSGFYCTPMYASIQSKRRANILRKLSSSVKNVATVKVFELMFRDFFPFNLKIVSKILKMGANKQRSRSYGLNPTKNICFDLGQSYDTDRKIRNSGLC